MRRKYLDETANSVALERKEQNLQHFNAINDINKSLEEQKLNLLLDFSKKVS